MFSGWHRLTSVLSPPPLSLPPQQSIDPLELEIKQRVGTVEECRQASVVLPLIQRHHYLLVTLLLYNSAANETLPLFLDRLGRDYRKGGTEDETLLAYLLFS